MHRTGDELEAGLAAIGSAPRDGVVRLIVRRPAVDERVGDVVGRVGAPDAIDLGAR